MDLTSKTVFLGKCSNYLEDLPACINTLLGPCCSSGSVASARVLLKPNLISARMGTLACTEGAFILEAARWFIERNARVTIGDSPAFGSALSVLRTIGIADSLDRMGISVSNFDRVRHVTLPSGIRAGIAADALDCDLLVNLPRVKAHAQLRVTLAVKNLFGCLAGMRKPHWHMVHGGKNGLFTDLLVELLSVLPSGITLVDGITAMHDTGPVSGRPFPLGIVACGANPVAVDRALLALLGIAPESSPLMVTCMRKRLAGVDLESLDFPLSSPFALAVNQFVVPDLLSPVRFNPFRFVHGSLRRFLIRTGLFS